MFVRKKIARSGAVQHYLVENRREGGKVRQRVLFYLGGYDSVAAAVAGWTADARTRRALADGYERQAAALAERLRVVSARPPGRRGSRQDRETAAWCRAYRDLATRHRELAAAREAAAARVKSIASPPHLHAQG
jgi:hypothetical protein